ncbi:MAG: phosphoribosylaminoimidazolesuccinocarboxamide synthase [Deltaproteobacteria bacterium]|nr:phosphoribosylaminoimidazolesuccinocarboxamide synthase [Deltaproteobacteria bacterium]
MKLKLLFRGKVRDIYDCGDELLLVATDRLSAFDVVFDDPIPGKGEVLTQMSLFWFKKMGNLIENHLSSRPLSDILTKNELKTYGKRSMLVKKTKPLAIEAVVRGYLAGSGWSDYKKTGEICGVKLSTGLKEASKLEEPIFTPATKAAIGDHDENISFQKACEIVGAETANKVKEISLAIYKKGRDFAESKGLILADTKFEFGLRNGQLILIDELLTPDSSRFWPQDQYQVGISPPSFDKQFVRDYLLQIGWNKQPPAPKLPPDVIQKTAEKYQEALQRLTK